MAPTIGNVPAPREFCRMRIARSSKIFTGRLATISPLFGHTSEVVPRLCGLFLTSVSGGIPYIYRAVISHTLRTFDAEKDAAIRHDPLIRRDSFMPAPRRDAF